MMRLETAACCMCGTPDADVPVGRRWMCRPDFERLGWLSSELAAVAELCGLTYDQLRHEVTR